MKKGDIYESKNDGVFLIVSNDGWNKVHIEFPSGFRGTVTRQQVKNGTVKDYFKPVYYGVGYIGCRGLTKKDRKNTSPYMRWKRMLSRCYNENDKAYKNYGEKGVSVCPEWHDLRAYTEWIEQYEYLGMDVDKDILCTGERIYSPDTCVVVTHEDNCSHSFSRSYSFLDPEGDEVIITNLNKFCRERGLSHGNMHSVINGDRKSHKGYTKGKRL